MQSPERVVPAGEVVSAGEGAVAFEVEPDRTYLIGYLSPYVPLRLREVYVPPGRYLVEEQIELPPPVKPGRLIVDVLTSVGTPLQNSHRTEVFARDTGLFVASSAPHSGSPFLVPPGSYVVRAAEQPYGFGCSVGEQEPWVPDFAPAEIMVDVFSDQWTGRELWLGGNGRILLTVELPGAGRSEPWERLWDRAHEGTETLPGFLEHLRRLVGGLNVQLVSRTDGAVLRPDFHLQGLGVFETPWTVPGEACKTATPIPPGSYELVVELPDGGELRTEVTIRNGRVTTVVLRAN